MTKNDAVERALQDSACVFDRLRKGKPDDHVYHLLAENCHKALQALQTSRPDAGENPFSVDGTLARYAAKETVFNGIEKWARVVHLDAPSNFGTVMHCGSDGVVVRWDDGKIGELSWNDAVAYSAYRLQTVIRAALKSGDKGRWQDKYGYMPVGEAIEHAHAMREKYLAEHDGDEPATAEIVRWYCSEAHRLSKSFAPPTSEGV